MLKPLYELSVENYEALLSTGQGQLIYGSSFPANVAIFKSLKNKYMAVTQAYYVVNNVVQSTGASAADIMEFIRQYGETIADINNDLCNGLITETDMDDIVSYIDGTDTDEVME
jgi:hypothetical protein